MAQVIEKVNKEYIMSNGMKYLSGISRPPHTGPRKKKRKQGH